jgi:pimeloyl-ACP methyl ester carboxylesterase
MNKFAIAVLSATLVSFSSFTISLAQAAPATFRGGLSQKKLESIYARPEDGSSFFELDGKRMHYRIRGSAGQSPPVILLHGALDSLHSWDEVSAQLEPNMLVISLDLAGFGLSDGVNYSNDVIYNFHVVLTGLISHLKQNTNIDVSSYALAGHSLGGLVAWTYALENKEVSQLILVGPAGYRQKVPPLAYLGQRVGAKILNWLPNQITEPAMIWAFYWDLRLDILGDSAAVTDLYGKAARMAKIFLSEGNIDSYFDLIGHFQTYDFEHEHLVPQIQQPTLILLGDEDDTVSVKTSLPRWKQDLPNARIVEMKGIGHYPQWESTNQVSNEITEFLLNQ